MGIKLNRHQCISCGRFKCGSVERMNPHLHDCGCTHDEECRNCDTNRVLADVNLKLNNVLDALFDSDIFSEEN